MALYCDDIPDDIGDDDNAELAPLERRLEMLERLEEAARGNGLPSLLMELRYELMVLVLESRRPLLALWYPNSCCPEEFLWPVNRHTGQNENK